MKPLNLPMPAWHITSEEVAGNYRLNVQLVHVTALTERTAFYEIRWPRAASEGYRTLPAVKASCEITALASTRKKALLKIEELMTALESRPPTPIVGMGVPPRGTTETGAAKFPPPA